MLQKCCEDEGCVEWTIHTATQRPSWSNYMQLLAVTGTVCEQLSLRQWDTSMRALFASHDVGQAARQRGR